MSGALYFDWYHCGMGREQMLYAGRTDAPRLLIIPPLFNEMNRLRRTLVIAMRMLADLGIGSALPDLPGLNESATPLPQCRVADWHSAVHHAALAANAGHVAGLRSACVLDSALRQWPRWRYAAISGDRVMTQMLRAQLASDKANGVRSTRSDYDGDGAMRGVHLTGYTLSTNMLHDLADAPLMPLDGMMDCTVEQSLGPALWLRAEPGESAELAQALATHWAEWMRR